MTALHLASLAVVWIAAYVTGRMIERQRSGALFEEQGRAIRAQVLKILRNELRPGRTQEENAWNAALLQIANVLMKGGKE